MRASSSSKKLTKLYLLWIGNLLYRELRKIGKASESVRRARWRKRAGWNDTKDARLANTEEQRRRREAGTGEHAAAQSHGRTGAIVRWANGQFLRQNAAFRNHGNEVRITCPAEKDVHVETVLDPPARRPAEVGLGLKPSGLYAVAV